MPRFSPESLRELETCDRRLQVLLKLAIRRGPDFKIIQGARSVEEQEDNVAAGVSQTMDSRHLDRPSKAVDLAPYPIDWEDATRFYVLGGYIMAMALWLGYPIRWGGDWDGDWSYRDQKFHDLGHFELTD